jgi:hypothetical protein
MKYYLHDSNSFSDEKITELYINFGYEGLGLFYTFLEKIALQEKPIKTSVLKSQLNVGKKLEKCWNFMESLGIISSNNGESFNEQLLNFSGKYAIKKEKNREKVKQWREKQADANNVTSYQLACNATKVNKSKVNKSKVKESKENKESEILIFPFSSDLFIKVWEVLIKEKKWRGKSFAALQASLEQLGKYPEDEAIQMMKNTIAGGWQGLFEIKKNNINTIGNGQQQPISKAQQILESTEWVRKKLAERRVKQSGNSDSNSASTSGN